MSKENPEFESPERSEDEMKTNDEMLQQKIESLSMEYDKPIELLKDYYNTFSQFGNSPDDSIGMIEEVLEKEEKAKKQLEKQNQQQDKKPQEKVEDSYTKIEDLEVDSWADIKITVLEVEEGNSPNINQRLRVSDESGGIDVVFWNNDIDYSFELDSQYILEGVRIEEYRGDKQVEINSNVDIKQVEKLEQ